MRPLNSADLPPVLPEATTSQAPGATEAGERAADRGTNETASGNRFGKPEAGASTEARAKWVRAKVEKPSRTAVTSGTVRPVAHGVGDRHSIFAQALIEVLKRNDGILEARRVFGTVSNQVASTANSAGHGRTPRYAPLRFAGHGGGDFFFVPKDV